MKVKGRVQGMKNVKLIKAKQGYFLTIGEDNINNRWAVTALELVTLLKILKDNEEQLMKDISK